MEKRTSNMNSGVRRCRNPRTDATLQRPLTAQLHPGEPHWLPALHAMSQTTLQTFRRLLKSKRRRLPTSPLLSKHLFSSRACARFRGVLPFPAILSQGQREGARPSALSRHLPARKRGYVQHGDGCANME